MKWYEDPIYHKMCERSEIIQKNHDFSNVSGIIGIHNDGSYFYIGRKIAYNAMRNVWLPTQADLQEMIKIKHYDWDVVWWETINKFNEWCKEQKDYSKLFGFNGLFASMEQLWIAFVMSKKFSKKWSVDKQEWIECK